MRVALRPAALVVVVALLVAACGASAPSGANGSPSTAPVTTGLGEQHAGDYSLGPVAFSGSFWNSCAPYTPDLEKRAGANLAGLALRFNGSGALCDACVLVKSAKGRSVVARVVTTGETVGPNDLDLSAHAFEAINQGEYPRTMTWQLVKCPAAADRSDDRLRYQFQTEANPYWTSLWVRGGRLPIRTVEVKSENHPRFVKLVRGGDGTLTDEAGFGEGSFTLRVTAYDGQVVTDTFDRFVPGGVLTSSAQFD